MRATTPGRRHPFGLTALFGLLYFIQGVTEPTDGLITQPVLSLLKSWGQSAAQMSTFAAIVALPWALKPIYGLISDFLPLAGYHRKSYLIASSALTAVSLGILFAYELPAGSVAMLMLLLLPATLGVAFADVVIDAIMIEKGQPHGWTGRFQAVQWATLYGATILTGWLGGYLSQHGQQPWGFAICGSLTLVSLALATLFVSERPAGGPGRDARATRTLLRHAAGSRTILAAAAFLFLWNFNPFSTTVLYLHMTEALDFSEQFYGTTRSIEALALAVGSLLYASYCRRVSMPALVQLSIVLGIASSLAYWALSDRVSAQWIAVGVGLATATATMVQLDLAAQVCPPQVAGTLFALLMGLANLGIVLATWFGGWCYQQWLERWDAATAFNLLVGVGALFTAGCWLITPSLTRAIKSKDSIAA